MVLYKFRMWPCYFDIYITQLPLKQYLSHHILKGQYCCLYSLYCALISMAYFLLLTSLYPYVGGSVIRQTTCINSWFAKWSFMRMPPVYASWTKVQPELLLLCCPGRMCLHYCSGMAAPGVSLCAWPWGYLLGRPLLFPVAAAAWTTVATTAFATFLAFQSFHFWILKQPEKIQRRQ